VLGFSFKAILIKLAYAWTAIDPVTLLALRMVYSAPFFIAMAWFSGRAAGASGPLEPDVRQPAVTLCSSSIPVDAADASPRR